MSIRADLLPDLAIIEQTYTVANSGSKESVTMGLVSLSPIEEETPQHPPLAVRGWLDGRSLPSEDVQLQSVLPSHDSGPGWKLALTCQLPAGESIISVLLVVPTVPIERGPSGVSRPVPSTSALTLDGSYSAWAWGAEESAEQPEVATALSLSAAIPVASLVAKQWMPGAVRHESITYWERLPNLDLRYDAEADAMRVRTMDGLRRIATDAIGRPARGHIDIPASAVAVEPPGRAMGELPINPERTRRAMLVPAIALLVLLAAAYMVRRRWEKRL